MALSFRIVDTPAVSAGKAKEPNPFAPAAQAAVQAQEKGKSIAFPLPLDGYDSVEKAEKYVTRKLREMGTELDRTFRVKYEDDADGVRTVIVTAQERITRAPKAKKDAEPTA